MTRWGDFRALTKADRSVILRAVALNVVLNATAKSVGIKRAYALSERVGTRSTKLPTLSELDYAAHVADLVNHVSTRFPARSACLVRSLTLRSLLLRSRIPAELRIGAKQSATGLMTHAWVEVRGIPVNDAGDIGQEYAAFGLKTAHWQAGRGGADVSR